MKQLKRKEDEIERLERDLAKVQNKYRTEVTQVEKESDSLRKKIEEIENSAATSVTRLRNMEIDNDNFERQLREADYTI